MLLRLNESSFGDSNPDQAFFFLFGDISDESIQPLVEFVFQSNFAQKNKPAVLNVVICSGGGSMTAAMCAVDCIRGSLIPVRCIGLGTIASAALLIFLSGTKGMRVVTENTSVLSHWWQWGASGTPHMLAAAVKEFDLTTKRMIAHYVRCTKLKEKEVIKYLLPKEDMYLTTEEVIKFGIADVVADLK